MTLRQSQSVEASFMLDMKTKYHDNAEVLRVINYYETAQAMLRHRADSNEMSVWRLQAAAVAFHEALGVAKQRAAHHKAQRKLWQRRAKAVFRLHHGRLPTVAELEAAVTKDWKS